LINLAQPKLAKSTVVDTNTGKACIPTTVLCLQFFYANLTWLGPHLQTSNYLWNSEFGVLFHLLQLWHVKMSKANFNELMRSCSMSFSNLIVCQLTGEQS
jgi:hypothetical protein